MAKVLYVDQKECTRCGICEEIYLWVFRLNGEEERGRGESKYNTNKVKEGR